MKRHELCSKPHHANHVTDKKTGMDWLNCNCGE